MFLSFIFKTIKLFREPLLAQQKALDRSVQRNLLTQRSTQSAGLPRKSRTQYKIFPTQKYRAELTRSNQLNSNNVAGSNVGLQIKKYLETIARKSR